MQVSFPGSHCEGAISVSPGTQFLPETFAPRLQNSLKLNVYTGLFCDVGIGYLSPHIGIFCGGGVGTGKNLAGTVNVSVGVGSPDGPSG